MAEVFTQPTQIIVVHIQCRMTSTGNMVEFMRVVHAGETRNIVKQQSHAEIAQS